MPFFFPKKSAFKTKILDRVIESHLELSVILYFNLKRGAT